MSYQATLTIGIQITDGPPAVKEQRVLTDIISANANRIAFVARSGGSGGTTRSAAHSSDNVDHVASCRQLQFSLAKISNQSGAMPAAEGHHVEQQQQQQQQQQKPPAATQPQTIAFVAIKATKYTYKRCVNNETSGVGFRLTKGCDATNGGLPVGTCNKIEWIKGDRILLNVCGALDAATGIEIYVDDKLFDCTKKEADEVLVTITYGVAGAENAPSDGTTDCCKPEVALNRRCDSRQAVMS